MLLYINVVYNTMEDGQWNKTGEKKTKKTTTQKSVIMKIIIFGLGSDLPIFIITIQTQKQLLLSV